jgi:hypothetical protein
MGVCMVAFTRYLVSMPPKMPHSAAAADCSTAATVNPIVDSSSPPASTSQTLPSLVSGGGCARPRPFPIVESSPKKFVRNIVNVSLNDWMERCPDPSPMGCSGTGSTFAVIIEQMPTIVVTTKKDNRKVAKKTIIIGDVTGKQAEITIWGNFAARSWMYPEGSVLLFKNLRFSSYYLNKMQLAFADSDPVYEFVISKADESLDITLELKKWLLF